MKFFTALSEVRPRNIAFFTVLILAAYAGGFALVGQFALGVVVGLVLASIFCYFSCLEWRGIRARRRP